MSDQMIRVGTWEDAELMTIEQAEAAGIIPVVSGPRPIAFDDDTLSEFLYPDRPARREQEGVLVVEDGPDRTPTAFTVDIVDTPPAFTIAFTVRLDRLRKRKCRACGKRRIVYALRGYAGGAIINSSPLWCARCAGLVG